MSPKPTNHVKTPENQFFKLRSNPRCNNTSKKKSTKIHDQTRPKNPRHERTTPEKISTNHVKATEKSLHNGVTTRLDKPRKQARQRPQI